MYPDAQLDYPIPLLDRLWGLWADGLGEDTKLASFLNQSECSSIMVRFELHFEVVLGLFSL